MKIKREVKKAIYLRKSRGEIKDLEKHKRQLLKICDNNKWEYDLYEEIASSEKLEEREALTNLLNNIKKYDGILCVHIDRLSRNELHQALITKILKENNIKLITLAKVYDFNEEGDILLGDFEKLIARQELRLTKTRLKRGKLAAFEKGFWVNGVPPMPYRYNKNTKLLYIDNEKLEKYMSIKTLALEGESINFIGEVLNMSPSTVRGILKSKVHLGYTKYDGEYKLGAHKPVISSKEYEKINIYLKKRTNNDRRIKKEYLFSGLIRCSCGHRRTVVKFGKKEGILKCKYCNDRGSIISSFQGDIEKDIKNYIKNNEKDNKVSEINKIKENIKIIDCAIKKISIKEKNIKEAVIEGLLNIKEGKWKLSELDKKKIRLNEEKKIKINEIDRIEKDEECINLKDKNFRELNKIYKKAIEFIEVKNGKIVRIDWK